MNQGSNLDDGITSHPTALSAGGDILMFRPRLFCLLSWKGQKESGHGRRKPVLTVDSREMNTGHEQRSQMMLTL